MVTNLLQSGVAELLTKSIVGHAQEGVTQTVYFEKGYTVAQKQQAMEGLYPLNSMDEQPLKAAMVSSPRK